MIIETVLAYLAIIAPSAVTIITALIAIITAIAKFLNVVKQNQGLKDEMTALVKYVEQRLTADEAEKAQLRHALTECTTALTRLRNTPPPKKEEANDE